VSLPAGAASSLVSQDEAGNVTLRATRVKQPIRVDGKLDEEAYSQIPAITGLIQNQPLDGEPVSERTEVWILFDDDNLYVTCRCWHRRPERMVLDDMRRDVSNQGEYFSINLDTFLDRRNSYLFYINPMGGMSDVLTTDERNRNDSWNGVWDSKASQFEGGWGGEMMIPFKTLRYRPGRDQVWGVTLRRRIRDNADEHSFLPRMPRAWGPTANLKMSAAATLTGLQAPPPSVNLEIKPYAITTMRTDREASPPSSNDADGDIGFDVKYGITKSLTLDVTYNTDFAQVEDDQAQVNLTRFSLFFPEKREFFLEGQGLFTFGSGAGSNTSVVPVMFFSRRIGLHQGRPIPIVAGTRMMGQAGRYSLGALSITTDDDGRVGVDQTTFNVVRIKRDILRRSTIGALVTHRSNGLNSSRSAELYGVDALFTFYESLNLSGYLAKTHTPETEGDDLSYRAQLDYAGDRYGLQVERLTVDDNFNPEVGFLRREDFRRTYAQARFSPRPERAEIVRKYNYEGSVDYITDNENTLESRIVQGTFRIDFQSSNQLTAEFERSYELIERAFSIADDVDVPSGGYEFNTFRTSYLVGQQHRVSGTAAFERGGFYGGDKSTASFRGRVKFGTRLALEPTISVDWIDLPTESLVTKVVSTRATYNFSPRMFVGALVQYNSSTTSFSTNLRFRWEYQPGNDLFVVYTEGRDTFPPGRTALENRGFAVKLTRLFRF
jgi:hypothetical protein